MPSTILLAEDEHAIAETVLYALRADGFAAEHVLLGGSVLPRLKQGGIDLVTWTWACRTAAASTSAANCAAPGKHGSARCR